MKERGYGFVGENAFGVISVLGIALEVIGVLVIVLGAVVSSLHFARQLKHWGERLDAYATYRANIARSLLLGLEFLVAGDVIRTVVVEPTLPNVGSLGVVVLIRTFLGVTLEMEVSGRWPWERPAQRPDRNV